MKYKLKYNIERKKELQQLETALNELHKSNDISDAANSTLKFTLSQLKNCNLQKASDSISIGTKDYETVRVKVGKSNISIKITYSNGTFNTIYIEEGQQLFDYLKKYYY